MRRLYISDLDGTLLGGDRGLGRRTREVLDRFIGRGGRFTIATGRSAASCTSTLGGLGLKLPAITHNGALTCDLATGQPTAIVAMDPTRAGGLFARAVARGLAPVAYGVDGQGVTWLLHAASLNAPTRRYRDALAALHPCVVDEDGSRLAALQPLSLILLDEPAGLAPFLTEACSPGSGFTSSLGRSAYTPGLGVGEVQSELASKGHAAAALAGSLGLGPAEIVAFGDSCNDLPLLGLAGLALCPPDADPAVLAAVPGRIGRAAEEGVAAFLEERLAELSLDRTGSAR